jgi:hypothetical protein
VHQPVVGEAHGGPVVGAWDQPQPFGAVQVVGRCAGLFGAGAQSFQQQFVDQCVLQVAEFGAE